MRSTTFSLLTFIQQIFYLCFSEVYCSITDKTMTIKGTQCLDIHIDGEMITTIKLIIQPLLHKVTAFICEVKKLKIYSLSKI